MAGEGDGAAKGKQVAEADAAQIGQQRMPGLGRRGQKHDARERYKHAQPDIPGQRFGPVRATPGMALTRGTSTTVVIRWTKY